jgi:hypothetical protein
VIHDLPFWVIEEQATYPASNELVYLFNSCGWGMELHPVFFALKSRW